MIMGDQFFFLTPSFNFFILFHCEVCQLFHQIKRFFAVDKHRKVVRRITCCYFNAVREEQVVSAFQMLLRQKIVNEITKTMHVKGFDSSHNNIGPTQDNLGFFSQEEGVEADVIDATVHPTLARHSTLPVAARVI